MNESSPQPNPSQETMQTLIPTQNKPALFAYYFGVFGLIPFLGLPLAIVGIILGIMGLKKYKANPTPGAKGHALAGLILGIFELLVFTGFMIWVFVIAAQESRLRLAQRQAA